VCWELLKVLRGDTAELDTRGYHTTIFPVELPAWLPPDVIRTLLGTFKIHLRQEIDTMVVGYAAEKVIALHTQQHGCNASLQSDSSDATDANNTSIHNIPYWESTIPY
jgi:hypothetical protein